MLGHHAASISPSSARFRISAPAVSQHLKVLRQAGLVRVRVQAQSRIYELDPAGLVEVDEWLNRVRRGPQTARGGRVELRLDVEESAERKCAGSVVRGTVTRCEPPRALAYT